MERWVWIVIAIVIYAAIMLWVGVRAEKGDKKSKNLEDYFVGGRSMGPLLSLGALTSTMLSSFALLGMPGMFYRTGVGSWMLILVNGLLMAIPWYLFAFRMRRLGTERGYMTMGDFFEDRYSKPVRTVSAVLMVIVSVPYVAIQIQGFGNIAEGASGGKIPYVVGSLFLSIIMVVYIFQGGYKGVAATDAVQAGLMVFALLIGGMYAAKVLCGGFTNVFKTLAVTNPEHLTLPGALGSWNTSGMVYWSIVNFGAVATPQCFQKFFTSKDLRSQKTALFLHPILAYIIYTGAMLIGLCGLVAFPGLVGTQSDNISLMLIVNYLPIGLAMFITCGIVAAAMSTADSQYITISSLIVRDIYTETFCKSKGVEPDMSKILKLSRWFSIVLMIIGFCIAYARLDTLVGMLTKTVYPGAIQMFIPMIAGLYWKGANSKGAFAGMISGFVVAVLTLFVPPFTAVQSIINPIFVSAATNIVVLVVVSLCTRKTDETVIKTLIDDVNEYIYDPLAE